MSSAGKEGKWREELATAQRAYRQIAAKEERTRNRISGLEMGLDAAQRALLEAKILLPRMQLSGELQAASQGKSDPRTGLISLINRAIRAIEKARNS